jgi:RNA 2',3'-cyclic 3'-phosphodiesterase
MSTPAAPAPSTARLFVGLWPDDAVRDAVSVHGGRWGWVPSARLVPRSKLHMTLHFLGAVPQERISDLITGLAVPFVPFAMQLDKTDVWPNEVAVLQPRVLPSALLGLHARLQQALAELQQPTAHERLLPHVTLARKAKGSRAPAEVQPVTWRIDGYALIESMPGSVYKPLVHYP